jgi:hypothetical protein
MGVWRSAAEAYARPAAPVFGNVPPSGAGWLPDRGRVSGRRGDATCRIAEDAAVRVDVPSVTVTFVFTDVEGSTRDEVA